LHVRDCNRAQPSTVDSIDLWFAASSWQQGRKACDVDTANLHCEQSFAPVLQLRHGAGGGISRAATAKNAMARRSENVGLIATSSMPELSHRGGDSQVGLDWVPFVDKHAVIPNCGVAGVQWQ
jgi:hypothetical protein